MGKKAFLFMCRNTGQPRTGDTANADLLEAAVGWENIFRGELYEPLLPFSPVITDRPFQLFAQGVLYTVSLSNSHLRPRFT